MELESVTRRQWEEDEEQRSGIAHKKLGSGVLRTKEET